MTVRGVESGVTKMGRASEGFFWDEVVDGRMLGYTDRSSDKPSYHDAGKHRKNPSALLEVVRWKGEKTRESDAERIPQCGLWNSRWLFIFSYEMMRDPISSDVGRTSSIIC